MYNIAINMLWFNRNKYSSDYIYFENLLSGFIAVKDKKKINITIYIRKKYEYDLINFIKNEHRKSDVEIVIKNHNFLMHGYYFKKYNLVFTPNWYFPAFFSSKKTKFLSLIHDSGWKNISIFKIRSIYGRLILPLLSRFLGHKLVYTTDEVSKDYTQSKNVVGVPISVIKKSQLIKIPFKKYFLIISTNLPHKNLDVIKKVFTELDQNIINLILVGDHPSFNMKNTKVFKNITKAEKWYLIENCVALINPSSFEGFGMPVAETN